MKRASAVVVLLAISMAGCTAPPSSKAEKVGEVGASSGASSGADDSSAAATFKIGDVVKKGKFEAAVLSINANVKSSNQFEKPDEGKKWFAVEFQLKNNGKESESISTIIQFKLKDNTNAQYDVGFTTQPEPKFPDGELAAGDTARGWITFEIPPASAGLKFIFDAEVFGGGRVTWDLGV